MFVTQNLRRSMWFFGRLILNNYQSFFVASSEEFGCCFFKLFLKGNKFVLFLKGINNVSKSNIILKIKGICTITTSFLQVCVFTTWPFKFILFTTLHFEEWGRHARMGELGRRLCQVTNSNFFRWAFLTCTFNFFLAQEMDSPGSPVTASVPGYDANNFWEFNIGK